MEFLPYTALTESGVVCSSHTGVQDFLTLFAHDAIQLIFKIRTQSPARLEHG